MNVATNLGIGLHTLYAWCRQYDIDIRSYRFATTRTDEFNPYAT